MELSEQVLRVLRFEKISEEELAKMLGRACITSLRGFNRRYYHWIFKVQGDTLVEIQRADLLEVGKVGKGKTRMMEEHDACAGRGCRACGWVGQIGRWVADKKLPTHAPWYFGT